MSFKGALVLRGADGNPHQVRIEAASVVAYAGRRTQPIPLGPLVLEVAPTLDLFVPFEVPLADLDPGWYRIECSVVVDGIAMTVGAGDRFLIPWPRSAVRRGSVPIGLTTGDVTFVSLECGADSVRVIYAAADAPSAKIAADDVALPVLEVEHDVERGEGAIVAYPAMRAHRSVVIEVKGERPVTVSLD